MAQNNQQIHLQKSKEFEQSALTSNLIIKNGEPVHREINEN